MINETTARAGARQYIMPQPPARRFLPVGYYSDHPDREDHKAAILAALLVL